MIKVQSDIFDPGAELNNFMQGRTDMGAVVSFTGHVRGQNDISALELEHYAEYTETEIGKIEIQAQRRWPGIHTHIIHRYGKMKPGEPIVFVAVCSAHRQDSFRAATFLMDSLKTRAPFWKKEISGDKGVWIEPKASDYAAEKQWTNKV